MLYLLKAAALGAVLSMNVLTLSSAPARAGEAGLPRSAEMLDACVYVPCSSRNPRWVVLDFVTGQALISRTASPC
jgi:hypothetical protein